ncbi:aldehyde dehydrogenase family 3 member B2 isoform X3 [Rousettus aegyptiacus]|nr:aldehyde dehydrogenase family 3 member B2 isoform X3 [Rousettus aegyptiacus]XP_036076868.1 aldehyde dehydrogenase family 3 member B2 isoform X3 [Rousettus aegyptiacus]
MSEISIAQGEIDWALRNLHSWMEDENVSKSLATQLDSAFIRKEPFGLVLIIAPWNYPLNLTLVPLVGALAAGNCVVLKPSEISQSTEKVLAEVLPRYLDQSCFAVVLGGPEETGRLLEHKFDYIFFTGSPRVGKIVMTAASKHLTPVTLELGGKNPCYVDDDCDPQTVANRVAFFRYFNAGQTCVAPDYVLCSPETQERLLPALQNAITRFYGEDPRSSPDLGRIINEKHFQRLRGLLGCGRVAIGGQSDESERYIAPTVLVDVQDAEPVMQEEIFGPILPIMNVRGLDEAIDVINRREKPLALYAFSNRSQVGPCAGLDGDWQRWWQMPAWTKGLEGGSEVWALWVSHRGLDGGTFCLSLSSPGGSWASLSLHARPHSPGPSVLSSPRSSPRSGVPSWSAPPPVLLVTLAWWSVSPFNAWFMDGTHHAGWNGWEEWAGHAGRE